MTFRPADPIQLHAVQRPDHPAIVDLETGQQLTYAALHHRIAQAVTVLAGEGVGPGDRVAVLSRNRADYVVVHMACARIGAIVVALNWRLAGPELAAQMRDAEPALLIADGSVAQLDEAARALCPVHDFDGFSQRVSAAAPDWRQGEDDLAPSLLLFTSGTSGRSKGALLSERNLFYSSMSFVMLTRVTFNSVFLCESPLFHVLGLVTNVRAPLVVGGTVLISGGFEPARTYQRLSDPALKVTHYTCVPQMAEVIRREPAFEPDTLRKLIVVTGGAPHPPARIQEWLDDDIVLCNGFGMTETGTLCGMPADIGLIRRHLESVGPPTPLVEMRIADGGDHEVARGERGEIQIKGPGIFSSYWRNPEATQAAFTADGWFRTGDVATMDAEGYVTVVDRTKDMYISGGENVYPAEVEAVIAEMASVAEVAVIGISDERWGEVGRAYVAPARGATLTAEDVLAHCDGRLARYKVPKSVVVVEQLPRNGAGKVVKTALRDDAMETMS